MNANVWNVNTGVFVNGRHLPQSEGLIWRTMLGTGIQPGAYWLDAPGDAGNPSATVNFASARQNAYQGFAGRLPYSSLQISAGLS
ncbi:MAG: hypothetical protein AAGG11_10095 [Pseudomonadota bacterium]